MNGGELFHHLQKEQRFDINRSRFYTAELLCALECLHGFKVIYRDLKPENILLDYTGHIALCDFGLCKLDMKDEDRTNSKFTEKAKISIWPCCSFAVSILWYTRISRSRALARKWLHKICRLVDSWGSSLRDVDW